MEHGFVSLLLARGDTVAPSGLLARLCHAFLVFFTISKAISVSTGPIFTIFSPNRRYLREFSRSGPVFLISQGTLPWQPILCRTKLVCSEPKYLRIHWTDRKWKLCCDSTEFHDFRSFGILAFWNRLEYHNYDFSTLIGNRFCTSHENLVRFRLVILEF